MRKLLECFVKECHHNRIMEYNFFNLTFTRFHSDIIAELARVSALSHSKWMVPSSNPGEGRNYFYSPVGDGGLSLTCIDGCVCMRLRNPQNNV